MPDVEVSWGEGRVAKVPTLMVESTRLCTLDMSLVSTGTAVASPPASLISLSTVLMVDCGEFGFGGNGFTREELLVDLAAMTTFLCISKFEYAGAVEFRPRVLT